MLSGVNKKCVHCVNLCKQVAQVVIIFCPNFKNRVGITHTKTPKLSSNERNSKSNVLGTIGKFTHKMQPHKKGVLVLCKVNH